MHARLSEVLHDTPPAHSLTGGLMLYDKHTRGDCKAREATIRGHNGETRLRASGERIADSV